MTSVLSQGLWVTWIKHVLTAVLLSRQNGLTLGTQALVLSLPKTVAIQKVSEYSFNLLYINYWNNARHVTRPCFNSDFNTGFKFVNESRKLNFWAIFVEIYYKKTKACTFLRQCIFFGDGSRFVFLHNMSGIITRPGVENCCHGVRVSLLLLEHRPQASLFSSF